MKNRLGLTLLIVSVATLTLGINLLDSSNASEVDDVKGSASNNLELRVEEASSDPRPLDIDIQGSSRNIQSSQEGLQQSQDSSNLQPNAKQDSF